MVIEDTWENFRKTLVETNQIIPEMQEAINLDEIKTLLLERFTGFVESNQKYKITASLLSENTFENVERVYKIEVVPVGGFVIFLTIQLPKEV